MSPAEAAVRDVYINAQNKLNMMLAACHNEDERNDIKQQLIKARHNWQATENQAFQNNDPALQDLVTKTNAVADQLKVIETKLGNIKEVIDTITQGATYGAEIVAKIIAV